MATCHAPRRPPALLLFTFPVLTAATAATLHAQAADAPAAPALEVTDPRLAAALSRLLAGSPSAAAVVRALGESGLPVSVGTPGDLAPADPLRDADAPTALPADASGLAAAAGPQLAWVALQVATSATDPVASSPDWIERAWVVVDADRIEGLIRAQGRPNAEARIEDDLTIALAHELVAHVGSVARTRRIEDFCDDPLPGAHDGGLACSLRIENEVRAELNQSFSRRGARRYPVRRSYKVDVMNFAAASRMP